MVITWDETKRASNLVKHGLDFCDAESVIYSHLTLTVEDDRFAYGERRQKLLGLLNGFLITVLYTSDGDMIRVISMRMATRNERQLFQRTFRN